MKKLFILLAIAGIGLNSCSKEEITEEYTPLIAGKWKMSKIAVISGKDGHVLSSTTVEGCDLNNTFEFKNDNTFVFTYYGGGNCESSSTEDGSYDYVNSTSINKLYIKFTGDTEVDESIVQKLTELELQTYSTEMTDHNNDGVLDKEVVYMHR
ncbi:MAG: lipocalin family protein [Bacteroidetes bacterium]|nr:lipocalin family protein [Bacteroidota bacterium]